MIKPLSNRKGDVPSEMGLISFKLALSVAIIFALIVLGMTLYKLAIPPPDDDVNSLNNMFNEVKQGLAMIKATGDTPYSIIFPFSLQETYRGDKVVKTIYYSKTKNQLCLIVDTTDHSKNLFTRCRQLPDSITEVWFQSYPTCQDLEDMQQSYGIRTPQTSLTTPFSSLLPYELIISPKGDGYEAIIVPAKTVPQSC